MSSTLFTDWFKANYHGIDWTTPRQVEVAFFSRSPALNSLSAAKFSSVKALADLAQYPEYVPIESDTTATKGTSSETLYVKYLSIDATNEGLQLVYDNSGSWVSANVEDDAGWLFSPQSPATSLQELVSAAAIYLVGTYSGVVNPVLFVTDQGIGRYTVVHNSALFGQANTVAPSGKECILNLDISLAGAAANTLATVSRTDNVATVTTTTTHGFVIGDVVTIDAVDNTFDATAVVTAVPSATSFSYANSGSNVASTADAGSATIRPSAFTAAYLLLMPALPAWESSHAHHLWLEPQRTNLVANPSFEDSSGYGWRTNKTLTRVSGGLTDPVRSYCGRVSGTGSSKILESNYFPPGDRWMSVSLHVSATASSGTTASVKFGLVALDPAYSTRTYLSSDTFSIGGGSATGGFVFLRGIVPVPVNTAEMYLRIEASNCSSLWVDNVLVDPHEGQFFYFDGNSTDGLEEDFRWMGGTGYANQHFSLWYNNYTNTRQRLMGDYDTADQLYKPGLVEEWTPTGANIVAHWDAVTSFTPLNWSGDAFYPLATIAGTSPVDPDNEIDFFFVPK